MRHSHNPLAWWLVAALIGMWAWATFMGAARGATMYRPFPR